MMQKHFSNALSEVVSKHIGLSSSSQETLHGWPGLSCATGRSACGDWRRTYRAATTDSVRRRFYRFFQYVKLDGAVLALAVALAVRTGAAMAWLRPIPIQKTWPQSMVAVRLGPVLPQKKLRFSSNKSNNRLLPATAIAQTVSYPIEIYCVAGKSRV